MKQERLIETLEMYEALETRTRNYQRCYVMMARANGKGYINAIYEKAAEARKPIMYALRKAISKPVRMDGSRAHCPDCGAGVRKRDNYCFRCGQRLGQREQKKKQPFYGRYIKA